ncbi:MAG: DegT/DnrJ/EryC1/StrS family aminotransferase, partial [Phycisphaeraceae bacterium]|nr:DegT/DnrJ/EryC1/StrS family aminotransferase [Phycisphaeraceae bacterium]
SFNAFKNITCGEGGAVVSNDEQVAQRARCMTDCCGFYWRGRSADTKAFVAAGARASEIQGAMLSAQLDRLPGMLKAMRSQKKKILRQTAKSGLVQSPCHSVDYECGTHVGYLLASPEAAENFRGAVGGFIPGKTGRHVYTEWDPILERRGAHHPAMDPFKMPANRRCRMKYSKDMCPRSLEVLNRTVLIGNHPDRTPEGVDELIGKIKAATAAQGN